MALDILGTLFNSPARVKVMRLFLLNPDSVFAPKEVGAHSNISPSTVRKELNLLQKAGLIKKKKERREGGKYVQGYATNPSFLYNDALKSLLFGAGFVSFSEIGKKFRQAGRIKLLLLSGIFSSSSTSRLDILIVGDKLKRPIVDRVVRLFEAEIGKELAYAVFDTKEFIYRANMYDKLIRDVIDFPHENLIDTARLLNEVPHISLRSKD